MNKLTTEKLSEILTTALATLNWDLEDSDTKYLFKSIKTGEEAQEHVGNDEVLGYFCTEGTILSGIYYDAPSMWHSFQEELDRGLRLVNPSMFVEPSNSVEFTIYM